MEGQLICYFYTSISECKGDHEKTIQILTEGLSSDCSGVRAGSLKIIREHNFADKRLIDPVVTALKQEKKTTIEAWEYVEALKMLATVDEKAVINALLQANKTRLTNYAKGVVAQVLTEMLGA